MSQRGIAPVILVILIGVIAVSGYFVSSFSNKTKSDQVASITQTPAPTSMPQASSTPSELPKNSPSPSSPSDSNLENWKTYRDSKADFTIKYPSYMKINQQYSNPGTVLTLIPEEGWKCTIQAGEPCLSSFNVIIYPDYDGSSRSEWFDKNNRDLIPDRQTHDLMVDGVNALVMLSTTQGQTLGAVGLIPKGDKMYTVYFYFTLGLPPIEDRRVIVNKVLSTFEFTQN
jgi:hypothetical protein